MTYYVTGSQSCLQIVEAADVVATMPLPFSALPLTYLAVSAFEKQHPVADWMMCTHERLRPQPDAQWALTGYQ